MSNKIVTQLVKDYMVTGLGAREAHLEALETYKEIRAEIRSGSNAQEVLADYGLGEEFLDDVL